MLREILKLLKKDDLQTQAIQECYEMADMSLEMVLRSVKTLREQDNADIDIDIYTMDQKLNSFERDVRRKVVTHLSLGHTEDAGAALVLVSVVIDLERIGDYAKNVYDLAVSHPARLEGGPLEDQLAHIERHTIEIFKRTVHAFKNDDEDEARAVMLEYKEDISGQCRELENALVTGEVELPTSQATSLALYTRFLKRISAHSRNLVSSVVNPADRIGYPE